MNHLRLLGIQHRDIKPANILIMDQNEKNGNLDIKLTDYGISKDVLNDNDYGSVSVI